jgi:glyoxylase-like metal-dependent hydrolase (beta-lactamase superfamily II)
METVQLGNLSVARVEELLGPGFDPALLFPDWTQEAFERHRHWMVPTYYDTASAKFISSIHTWVVRSARHLILVDSCTGNHKQRPMFPRFHLLDTPFLQRLNQAGVDPAAVDFVLCTHLHVDHVGWNTQLEDGRWVPTFPNAKYIFSRVEAEHWDPALNPASNEGINANVYEDSVLPVIRAGQALLIEGEYRIDDELTIEPAPGHTAGHVVLKLRSRGQQALFSGDVMHQPIQILEPHWNSRFCELPEAARQTRRRLLEFCSEERALLLPAHFGPPHAMRVQRRGEGFAFEPFGPGYRDAR